MEKEILIAHTPVTYKNIQIQEVTENIGTKTYLMNINLLLNGKVIKKFRFKKGEKLYEQGTGEQFMTDVLTNILKDAFSKKDKKRTKKQKINKQAAEKAAKEFLNNINL